MFGLFYGDALEAGSTLTATEFVAKVKAGAPMVNGFISFDDEGEEGDHDEDEVVLTGSELTPSMMAKFGET